MRKPCSLADLQHFYITEYRPLYDRFVVENRLPQELHAEVAAAFDHLMRSVNDKGEIDAGEFDRVAGHLKRATFDSFKLLFENGIREKHDRFMKSQYADVEDGEFQPRIRKRFNEAVHIAREARTLEHSADRLDVEAGGKAFDVWRRILPIADEFTELESNPKILRAKSRSRVRLFWTVTKDVALMIGGAILGAILGWLIPRMLG